jgi:dipeptidyl aminopeptidase/acylaminoacyl peptidase
MEKVNLHMKHVILSVTRIASLALGFLVAGSAALVSGGSSEVPPLVEATSVLGILDVAWHPTEELLAVASETGLHLFDGDLQVILSVDTDTSFSSLDWSADGTQLAAGDWAQAEVRIYDFQPSQPALTRTRTLTEDAAYAMKVAWSSNGSYFAALFELRLDQTNAADPYGVVYTYDTSTWEHLTEDPFPIVIPSPVLSWNPDLDSTILLTAFQNAYFTFDAATLDVTWSVSYTIPSLSAAWVTEDTVAALVAGSFDLRDVENDQLLANLEWGGVISGANEIATDAEGTYVFTGLAIVEIATGVVLREYEVSHANYADWHPTLDLIAAVDYDELAILDATNLQPSSQPTFTPFPSLTPRPTRTASPSPTPTSTPRPSASSRAIYSARMNLPGGTESYWQLFLTDANGANPVNISSPNLTSPLYANDQQPQWSPDGLRILFTEQVSGSPHLAVMNADGSQRQVLTEPGYTIEDFSWAPDSHHVLFENYSSTPHEPGYYVMDITGAEPELLISYDDFGPVEWAVWSPLGNAIAFVAFSSAGQGIHLIDPAGSNVRLIPDTEGAQDLIAWSPDGGQIAFIRNDQV